MSWCCWNGLASFSFRSSRSTGPESRHTKFGKRRLLPVRHSSSLEEAYEVSEDVLGTGAFGEVRSCVKKNTTVERVAKIIMKDAIPDEFALKDELAIQCDLDHPHICRIFDFFETETAITLVLEACDGGDLFDVLCKCDAFSEADARHFMKQVLLAVCYMHSQRVAHRDLKPENFLLCKSGIEHSANQLKVIDFGFARDFEPGRQTMLSKCGTPHFIAPEIWSDAAYDEKCDVWSCGVILYLFLSGCVPFEGEEIEDIMAKIKATDRLHFDDALWEPVSPPAKLAIAAMLNSNPGRRVSAEKALRTPWLETPTKECLKTVGSNDSVHSSTILKRMRSFRSWNSLKKAAAHLAAYHMDDVELQEIRNSFQAMDTNSDGKLTLEELRAGLGDAALVQDDIDILFKQMDTDGSGELEWTEFLTVLSSQRIRDCREACQEAFEILDMDGDGRISLEEMLKSLSRNASDGEFDRADFRLCDKDGDGFICFAEFADLMTQIHCADQTPTAARRSCRNRTCPPAVVRTKSKQHVVRTRSRNAVVRARTSTPSTESGGDSSSKSLYTPNRKGLGSF